MSRKFKVIGLALVAVCAFGAISASAQAAPQWTVGGKAITENKEIAGTALLTKGETEVKDGTAASSTLTIPNLGITLTCTGLDITGGKIEPTKTGSATSLRFTGCIVASAPLVCQVRNKGGPTVGTIETLGLSAELITNASGTFAKFKPTAGGNFVEISIEKSGTESCGPAGNYAVAGEAALKLVTGPPVTYVEGTASAAVQNEAGTNLTFGKKEAFLDATVDLALASDLNWGVDA